MYCICIYICTEDLMRRRVHSLIAVARRMHQKRMPSLSPAFSVCPSCRRLCMTCSHSAGHTRSIVVHVYRDELPHEREAESAVHAKLRSEIRRECSLELYARVEFILLRLNLVGERPSHPCQFHDLRNKFLTGCQCARLVLV